MNMQLFPDQFLGHDECFGLFSVGDGRRLDLPIAIVGDRRIPVHVVHSDPDYLAYLVALIVLQAWTMGIDELGIPPAERQPLLVVTDKPGRFGEAYRRLHVPAEKVKALCVRRRVTLFEKTGRVPDASTDKSGYWESYLKPGDTRTALHNFFPAYQIFSAGGNPRVLAGRQYLGRGDEAGPAVLITPKADQENLRGLCGRYHPLLVVVDANAAVVLPRDGSDGTPTLVYHESIFAPELARREADRMVLCCLPDSRFEQFCAGASLRVVEPPEPRELTQAWKDVDGALQALIDRLGQGRTRVLAEIQRSALRLRNLLLSLPVGIDQYEQGLKVSGQPESLWYGWSITEPLQALESRLPEMAALGEWEELILQELVDGFHRLVEMLRRESPKTDALLAAIRDSEAKSRRMALVVASHSVATALKWVIRFPLPHGLGVSPTTATAMTADDIRSLSEDQDCVIHQVFDPHDIFTGLARVPPRQITFILLQNELRFVGERFLRSRRLFPEHPANETVLLPMYQQIERLEPPSQVVRRNHEPTLFTDADFEAAMRLFDEGQRTVEYGTVLVEEGPDISLTAETLACLIRLEGTHVVFLPASGRVSYVRTDDSIVFGPAECLKPGDRLMIVNPSARESIAHRILTAKQSEEMDQRLGQTIKQWQKELSDGIQRLGLTHAEVLQKIRALGSKRISAVVVGQWARGDVLGPLDAQDIRRAGQTVGSQWLMDNWQRVGLALVFVRSGHRLLGRQITRIIEKAAVGDYELARQDEEFLQQIGITLGELQDAVTLLSVDAVSEERKVVPAGQIGTVIPL